MTGGEIKLIIGGAVAAVAFTGLGMLARRPPHPKVEAASLPARDASTAKEEHAATEAAAKAAVEEERRKQTELDDQTEIDAFRKLTAARRAARVRELCAEAFTCPGPEVDHLIAAGATDKERTSLNALAAGLISKRPGGGLSSNPFAGRTTSQLEAAARKECRTGRCLPEVLEQIYLAAPPVDLEHVRCVVRFEEDSFICRTGQNPLMCGPPPCP